MLQRNIHRNMMKYVERIISLFRKCKYMVIVYVVFFFIKTITLNIIPEIITAAVAQSTREFAMQAEGWVFESQPRQT